MDIIKLQVVINTLDKIVVSGKKNLSMLLGCINELENMVKAEQEKGEKK